MKNNPPVSVIIPVYNGEKYLYEAINSVLKQTYKPVEVIIIDGGSTDRSAEIIKSFNEQVKYFSQSNKGTAAARNYGIQVSRGSYFGFLDQDDLWTENKLQLQLNEFENDNHSDIVFGQVKQFYSPETDEHFRQNIFCPPYQMPGYSPSAMLIKRESFFRVGLFASEWQIGEWADWYARAVERKLKMIMLENLVTFRRIHEGNKGVLMRTSLTEYVRVLKASLDRQRSAIQEDINLKDSIGNE